MLGRCRSAHQLATLRYQAPKPIQRSKAASSDSGALPPHSASASSVMSLRWWYMLTKQSRGSRELSTILAVSTPGVCGKVQWVLNTRGLPSASKRSSTSR